LVFCGVYTTRGFLNIVYPDAFIGFAIYYGMQAVFCLIGPMIFRLGFKQSLIGSIVLFLAFVGTCSSYISWVMFIGSAFGGAANAIIWLAQGIYTSGGNEDQSIKTKVSANVGMFYGIYSINMILGNLLGLIVLLVGVSIQVMIWILMGLMVCGLIMSFWIRLPISEEGTEKGAKPPFLGPWKVLCSIKLCWWCIGLMFAQTLEMNVTFQVLPQRVNLCLNGDIYNAGMYLAYGVSSIGFSILWGRLYSWSWRFVCIAYLILEIVEYLGIFLLAWFNVSVGGVKSNCGGYWIIIGFVRGIGDYALNTIINVSLGEGGSVDLVFSLYRFLYAIFYVIGSILVGYVPFQWILVLGSVISTIGCIIFYIHKREVLPLSVIPPETIEVQFANSAIVLDIKK
jgi:MFS family permease